MITKEQLSRLGLFDARVPRYTSYPTAAHFSDLSAQPVQRPWIAALPVGSEISLYIHVPFCRRLCWFCACRTQGTSSDEPVRAYLATLLSELDLLADALPDGVRLKRIHWGGGTPTLMAPDMMNTLAARIDALAPRTADAEFSVEIDPNEIDDARLDALAAAGMNRASIGVQDFDPEIQKTIGREQTFEVTQAAVNGLRARGIRSLNADILYGLPFQTKAKITESVQKLLSLEPDRVALYGYAHVPWMARRQTMIPAQDLPSAEARLDLFETARKLFVWDSYAEIGIDHFALPDDGLALAQKNGTLRRNFQGYTDDPADALIGVGASAISKYAQGFIQNAPSTAAYQKAIRAGDFAGTRGHVFAGDDTLRSRMIEELMCDFRITTQPLIDQFGTDVDTIRAMYDRADARFPDMLTVSDAELEIKREARPLTRMIAREFDAYEISGESHSIAI